MTDLKRAALLRIQNLAIRTQELDSEINKHIAIKEEDRDYNWGAKAYEFQGRLIDLKMEHALAQELLQKAEGN